jgi:hypothetical protein
MMRSEDFLRDIADWLEGANFPDEILGEMAVSYAESCVSATRRLDDVVNLLSRGYRDEALGLADRDPSLREIVTRLDFPGRERWQQLISTRGLDWAPEIRLSQLEFLEDAYEERARLSPIMRRHRWLAVGRGPLKSRLATLRELATADPLNPIWPQDIEAFESARVQEIITKASNLISNRELAGLETLADEIGSDWKNEDAQSLKQRLLLLAKNGGQLASLIDPNEAQNWLNPKQPIPTPNKTLMEKVETDPQSTPSSEFTFAKALTAPIDWLLKKRASDSEDQAYPENPDDGILIFYLGLAGILFFPAGLVAWVLGAQYLKTCEEKKLRPGKNGRQGQAIGMAASSLWLLFLVGGCCLYTGLMTLLVGSNAMS